MNYIHSILITGGTGSFGRAFVRYVIEAGMDRVCVYSRGEHAQAQMREDFGATDQNRLRWFIGDVRDQQRLRRAMEGCDVVIHAAALKRIEVGHYNAEEMVKTNIGGAINVIEAAQDAAVRTVVALSSDKAYQPISPYGQSKALAEALFLNANNTRGATGPRFSCTRYGNVWMSAGSIVPRWRALIEAGAKRVPVTDPSCTRFFMRMSEAVELVAGTLDTPGGELRIPTLPAYSVGDLAEAMGVEMDVQGLPAWEKLHEGMAEGVSSEHARRMSVDELKEALRSV